MRGGERRETHCTEVKMELAEDVLAWAKSLHQKERELDLRQLQSGADLQQETHGSVRAPHHMLLARLVHGCDFIKQRL